MTSPEPLSYLDGRITVDPDLCNGRPTIRGLRITVETVLGFLSAGGSLAKAGWSRSRRSLLEKSGFAVAETEGDYLSPPRVNRSRC